MLRRTLLAASAAALILPAAASAKDFCVAAPAGCSGTSAPASGLAEVLAAAESNGTADRVFLGKMDLIGAPLTYHSAEPVEIVGSGSDKTFIRSAEADGALTLHGRAASIRGVNVQSADQGQFALRLIGAHAEDVAVEVDIDPSLAGAVVVQDGASIARSRVRLAGNAGIVNLGGRVSITDVEIDNPELYGVLNAGNETTIRRSRIHAAGGVVGARGHVLVADSLLDLRGIPGQAIGVAVADSIGDVAGPIDLDAVRVTIVGDAPDDSKFIGAAAVSTNAVTNAEIHLRDSVITGVGTPFQRSSAAGVTHIDADRVAHADPVDDSLDIGFGETEETNPIPGAPALDAQLRPQAGSPLVDAAGALADGSDVSGKPRMVDGNGDCTAKADIGAFELQAAANPACVPAPQTAPAPQPQPQPQPGDGSPQPAADAAPVLSGLTATKRIHRRRTAPKLVSARGAIRFTVSEATTVELRFKRIGKARAKVLRIQAPAGGDRLRFHGQLPGGARLKLGRYRVTAVAIDGAGQHSAPQRARFRLVR